MADDLHPGRHYRFSTSRYRLRARYGCSVRSAERVGAATRPLLGIGSRNAARAHLQVGDLLRAGRALVDADRTAPAEVRCRPVGRTVIAELTRGGPAPADVAHLASLVGLTR
ncbi:hypothetical protein ABT346_27360 [Micromonospora peucetia]|uniref:hypothetical protein n=1 Tax=Micromonospora peucetia TaxID=47871 RepID=UPI0033201669